MTEIPAKICTPIKWPGGKRWLVDNYPELFPAEFSVYREPFLGGASVFLHLAPAAAELSDVNSDLINFFACIRNDWKTVYSRLSRLQGKHSSQFYYRTRAQAPKNPIIKAVRFIYLNRTCFNGIYRVNREGLFNVPIGSKKYVTLPTDNFAAVSRRLKSAKLRCEDFESAIARATRGDLIFADPPYTANHNLNGFLKYNDSIFSWSDQLRLHSALRKAVKRGVKVMVTNANHESIRSLYADFKTHFVLGRKSVMAADAAHRIHTTELFVRSW